MPIGIGEDHEELRRTARRWVETRCPPEVPRALLDAESEGLPPFWAELADQGWLGIHVPEEYGGQGFGLMELAVVVEELARAAAPGPVLTTMLAAAILAGSSDPADGKELLPTLVDGSRPAVVALPGSGSLSASLGDDGSLTLSGTVRPVLAAGAGARLLLVPAHAPDGAGEPLWCALDLDQPGVSVDPLASLDLTRRVAAVGVSAVVIGPERRLRGVTTRLVRERALAIAAAECAGGSRGGAWRRPPPTPRTGASSAGPSGSSRPSSTGWPTCSSRWNRSRPWPGTRPGPPTTPTPTRPGCRPCWPAPWPSTPTWRRPRDVSRSWAGWASPGSTTPTSTCAGPCRSGSSWGARPPCGARPRGPLWPGAGGCSPPSCRPTPSPSGAEIRALVAQVAAATDAGRAAAPDRGERSALAPHWPVPYGRGAGPVEQLVIDEELAAAGVLRPSLAVGAWALPTIIAHGTEEQQERFVGPTLEGKIGWCQLFCEPGAGSDLAALSTRATQSRGRLRGQRPEGLDLHGPEVRVGDPAWPGPIPRPPSTRGSPTSCST